MKKRIVLPYFVGGLLAVLFVTSAHSEGLDFLPGRHQIYFLKIPRASSYQLEPGDYIEIGVTYGPADQRTRELAARKTQLLKISGLTGDVVCLSLSMSKREVKAMYDALSKPRASVALRIVKKYRHSIVNDAPDGDGLPELNFEDVNEVAQSR